MQHVAEARLADERREHLAFAPEVREPPIPAPAAARILVVDDQPIVCALIERTLTMAGYQIVGETSALAALERLAQAPGSFALVISNTRMPEMSGWELIARIQRQWPEQRLLRISGYYEVDVDRPPPDVDPSAIAFLPKPFLPEELVRHVTTVLTA